MSPSLPETSVTGLEYVVTWRKIECKTSWRRRLRGSSLALRGKARERFGSTVEATRLLSPGDICTRGVRIADSDPLSIPGIANAD